MKPEFPPETLKVYQLIKRTGMYFSYAGGSSANNSIGLGFYSTREEAEYNRTVEVLRTSPEHPEEFFVFELEIPNPVLK